MEGSAHFHPSGRPGLIGLLDWILLIDLDDLRAEISVRPGQNLDRLPPLLACPDTLASIQPLLRDLPAGAPLRLRRSIQQADRVRRHASAKGAATAGAGSMAAPNTMPAFHGAAEAQQPWAAQLPAERLSRHRRQHPPEAVAAGRAALSQA